MAYCRPQTETSDFKNLSDSLQKIYQESKSPYIILGGDFNLSGITWDPPLPSNPLQREIIDIAKEYGLEQMVTFLTRLDANGTEYSRALFYYASLVDEEYP